MQHPDEGTIHAWVDGELSVDEAATIEAHTATCAECSRAVAEARGIIAASSRIVTALDAVPGGVIPESVRPAQPVRRWYASTQLRAAAAVLFVAGTTLLVLERQDKSFDAVTARTVAAPIADAADGQNSAMMGTSVDTNASLQQEGAPVPLKSSVPTPPSRADVERDMTGPVVAISGRASGAKVEVGKERDELAAATADATDARKADAPPAEIQRQRAMAERRNASDSSARDAVASRNVATVEERVAKVGVPVTFHGLRAVRTDTVGTVKRTVYEVSPGIRVTLTETQLPVLRGSTTANRSKLREAATEAAPTAAAPTVQAVTPATPAPQASVPTAGAATAPANSKPVISITWTDPVTGRGYVLSGPLTKDELEAIRRQLPVEKR